MAIGKKTRHTARGRGNLVIFGNMTSLPLDYGTWDLFTLFRKVNFVFHVANNVSPRSAFVVLMGITSEIRVGF